jgi:hypothetical protein
MHLMKKKKVMLPMLLRSFQIFIVDVDAASCNTAGKRSSVSHNLKSDTFHLIKENICSQMYVDANTNDISI